MENDKLYKSLDLVHHAIRLLDVNSIPEKNSTIALAQATGSAITNLYTVVREMSKEFEKKSPTAMTPMTPDQCTPDPYEGNHIKRFMDILRTDDEYKHAVHSNIAMAFVDNRNWFLTARNKKKNKGKKLKGRRFNKHLSDKEVHEVANLAAEHFLNQFTKP